MAERSKLAVAGATGYLGGELAAELARRGNPPRALARRPQAAADLEAIGCEVRRADVLDPSTLPAALEGVDIAYYLVHSMGRGSDGNFAERDKQGARNFADAAAKAGVGRIVYLGGLGEGSRHLDSRHETARTLASSGIPVTYFRAAAVIGAGSESFRTILYLVRRLPAMVTPRWASTSTQPIAVADVTAYLASAAAVPASSGREIEVGGPEVTTYGGLLDRMAEAMGKRPRPRITVPLLTPYLSSLWIGLVTPVDPGVARPLIEGLSTETVVRDPSGMTLFEIEPTPLEQAMAAALRSSAG